MTMHETTANIGGHKYGLRFDGSGRVLETSCEGRWPWSNVATGSAWLDRQLAAAAKQYLENEAH